MLEAFVVEIEAQQVHNTDVIKLPPETVNYIRQNQINLVLKTGLRLDPNFNPQPLWARLGPGAELAYLEWFSTREALGAKRRGQ